MVSDLPFVSPKNLKNLEILFKKLPFESILPVLELEFNKAVDSELFCSSSSSLIEGSRGACETSVPF